VGKAWTAKERVVVVGAGPGGLAAAMLLAAQGRRVVVCEAEDQVGGRTARMTLGGYSFDRGPTFFLMPYVLEEIFAATGRRLSDYVELTRLDPMYRLIMGRRELGDPVVLDATQDIKEMSRRIGKIEPGDGAAFERFIADNRTKLRLMEPVLRSPMRWAGDVMNLDGIKFLPHLHPTRSVAGLLKGYFKSPYVRLGVSFQSKYLGMSPMDCPSLFTILPFIEYEYGVWHPTGGCNAITSAMAAVCEEMGVEIRLGAAVGGIEFDGPRVTGVRLGGGEVLSCEDVVVNADAGAALKALVPAALRARAGWSDAAIDGKRYSCSTFMLYLGVRGKCDHLPHHSIYISSKYEQNLEDITDRGLLSVDPSVYVCNASRTDATLAPDGCSSLYVLMPTPNLKTGMTWDAEDRAVARRLVMEQLRTKFGMPDIASRIEVEREVTPREWAGMGINFGATFNMAHNLGQMLHKRVPHRFPGAEGLWFVGGATHPGSGLPVIFLSAQILAGMMLAERGSSVGA